MNLASVLVEPAVVTVEDGYVQFLHDGRSVYEIPLSDAADALRWIEHIAPKTWVTKRHVEQFARIVADHVGARYR